MAGGRASMHVQHRKIYASPPSRGSCGSVGLAAEARARCRRFRLYAKNLSGLVSLSCESTINLCIMNAALRSLVRSDIFSCYRVGSRRKPLTPLVLVIRRHRAGAPACLSLSLMPMLSKNNNAFWEAAELSRRCQTVSLHPRAVMLGAPGSLATRGV